MVSGVVLVAVFLAVAALAGALALAAYRRAGARETGSAREAAPGLDHTYRDAHDF
jgi:hypothetical protein